MALTTRLLAGAVAGATGATALNIATYVDMVVRGRPASSTPERSVEALSARVGVEVPGDGDKRANRVHGLAGLLGLCTGVAIGMTVAGLDTASGARVSRLPVAAGACVFGGVALVGANAPMSRLRVTDPREWTAADWASDLVPHAAYGLAAAAAYRRAADG